MKFCYLDYQEVKLSDGQVATHLMSRWEWRMDSSFNLNITFTYFNLKYSGEACAQERVIGISSMHRSIGRYCGKRYNWTVVASIPPIIFKFYTFTASTSSFSLTFQLTYKILNSFMALYSSGMQFSHIESNSFVSPFSWIQSYAISSLHYYSYSIYVKKMFKLRLKLNHANGSKMHLYLYDGPGFNSKHLNIKTRTTFLSSSFQVFLIGKKYDKEVKIHFNSLFKKNQTTNYHTYLVKNRLENLYDVVPTVQSGLLCAINFEVLKGYHVNISIVSLKYSGSNVGYCKFGGLSVYDKVNGSLKEVFLSCDDMSNDFGNERVIVSNEHSLYLIVYTYWPYSHIKLNISVQPTLCTGVYIDV